MWPLGIIISIGVLAILFAAWAFIRVAMIVITVHMQSMAPALESGDRVLAIRYWPRHWLRYGRIVLVQPAAHHASPAGISGVATYIKRIIAVEGETVTTQLSEIPENFRSDTPGASNENGQRIWHIPPGHIFVRSDNHASFVDSLTWGPIPDTCVKGVVLMKLPRQTSR